MGYVTVSTPELLGQQGGAEQLGNALSQYGAAAQGRQAAQINAPTGQSVGAVYAQNAAAQMLQQQAQGNAPNAAAMQMSANMDQGLGAAYAAQRGNPLAGVTADRTMNLANSGYLGQGAAGTMAFTQQGQQGLNALYNAQGKQAIQAQNQDQQLALAQARIQQQQQASNNASQLAYQGMANSDLLAQLNADTNTQVAQYGDAAQLGVQNIQQQAAMNNALIGAGAQGASAFGSLAAKMAAGDQGDDGSNGQGQGQSQDNSGSGDNSGYSQ